MVPTPTQLQGFFSKPVFDPSTTRTNPNGAGYVRTEFANNYIDPSRFDPVATKLLSLYPKPNLSGNNNFFSNQREQVDNDQYIGRFDHRFSEKDNVFAHYAASFSTNTLPAQLPPPASSPSIVHPEAHSFVTSWSHIFSAALLNEARVGYQETREKQNINGTRLFEQYGIIGAPDVRPYGPANVRSDGLIDHRYDRAGNTADSHNSFGEFAHRISRAHHSIQ